MTIAAVLVAYAACVGTLGSRMLGRARWTARAPLLAILTYLTAVWSVVAALGLAGLTLAVHATVLGGGLSHLIGACVHRLRATYDTPGGATVAGLGLILAGGVVARTAVTALTHLRAAGRQAMRHAQTARLAGHPRPGPGGRAGGACPAARVLRRGPAPDGDRDHRRGAGARSRPAGRRAGARAGSPGQSPPPAAGAGAHRPPGAPVPAADAGRRRAGSAAGRDARRRRGHPGLRSAVAGHRPGHPRHCRQSRSGPRRGCHRLGAADPPHAGPGRATGPRPAGSFCAVLPPRSRWLPCCWPWPRPCWRSPSDGSRRPSTSGSARPRVGGEQSSGQPRVARYVHR